MKQVVAIYDKDIVYANHLSQYLEQNKRISAHIVCFTMEQSLLQFAKEESIALFIINEFALTDTIKQLVEESKIIVLREEKQTDGIYKYQSVEVLVQMICSYIEKEESMMEKKDVCIIGVYPLLVSDCSFSITLAQVLSKKEKVFYCDLGSFSCLNDLLEQETSVDLADSIYYMHQGILRDRLTELIQQCGEMEYIAPVRCPEDLKSISAEDILQLFKQLIQERRYDTIVLELAECMYVPEQILSLCKLIYMPVQNTLESELKKRKVFTYLKNNGKEALCERICLLTLPICRQRVGGVSYMEQLLWNEMGDFVRNLIG